MEGYCCVSLMDEGKWVVGDVRWGVLHRGQVYLFQSPAAQQKFLSDPDRYSPVLAGFDPVVYRESGQLRRGSRHHGLWFDDQMYLFSSEAALERFKTAPESFAAVVRQAMATNPGDVTVR